MALNNQFSFLIHDFLKQKNELLEPIEKINLVKVYFLDEGRNVYWGQWKRTYLPQNSIFFCCFEAEVAAEELRKKGSKFSIEEVPGILITTKNKQALIVHDTIEPLSNFCFENIVVNQKTNYALRRGQLLHDAFWAFSQESDFWSNKTINKDQLIILYGELAIKPITNRKRQPYMKFISYPPKSKYDDYLEWEVDNEYKIRDSKIYEIVKRSMKLKPLQAL